MLIHTGFLNLCYDSIALNVTHAETYLTQLKRVKCRDSFLPPSSSSGWKQVHLESCVKPTVAKQVQSVRQSKQAVQPTEPGHRSTVTTDMLHIHYVTTLGTFNTAVKALHEV